MLQRVYNEEKNEKRYQSDISDQTDLISFSGEFVDLCIGIVDIVNSTKITARLSKKKACLYYAKFLNEMKCIVEKFGAKVVKNNGDSLLFYFPKEFSNGNLANTINCGLQIVNFRKNLNQIFLEKNLPAIQYRTSLDYGMVLIAKQENSNKIDIFGPTVNMCSKINHIAKPNSIIIGSDLFERTKQISNYKFKEVSSFDAGLGVRYPIFSILPYE